LVGAVASGLVLGGAVSPIAFAVTTASAPGRTAVRDAAVVSTFQPNQSPKTGSNQIAKITTTETLSGTIIGLASNRHGTGYWEVASGGGIFAAGDASFVGSMAGHPLARPVIGVAPDTSTSGYWEAASDGGIFAFDANYYGSMGGHRLAAPVVGIAPTPDGNGYWEVARDGGIFAFGDARYYGSMGGHPLAAPVVGFAPTPDGKGYWEVARDGGIFAFGDARYHGSMGGHPLVAPVVGFAPTPSGNGYWEVGSDGGIFAFGGAHYAGSMGGHALAAPISGVTATPQGRGYWEVARDGGVFTFGGAAFMGRATRAVPATPPSPPPPPPPPPPPAPSGTSNALADPPANIPPNPPYTFVKGGSYSSSLPCWLMGQTAWIPEPSTSQCLTAEIEATNYARATQGLGAIRLPSNWSSLSPEEQLFVITDIERVSRGLPPAVGLSSLVDSYAQSGASAGGDPEFNFAAIATSDWWGSNYASGVLNALDSNYTWMYLDGYGGYNIDCTSPTASGCWGHRRNILNNKGGTLVMGAGDVSQSTGLQRMTELFVAVQDSADVPSLFYTWAEAVAAGAAG